LIERSRKIRTQAEQNGWDYSVRMSRRLFPWK